MGAPWDGPCFKMMNCEKEPNLPKEKEAERRTEVRASWFSPISLFPREIRGDEEAQEVGLKGKLELLKLLKVS